MALYEPFIDRTYFIGPITIGQVDQQAVEDELNLFIRKHEYEFLVQLLGLPLYKSFYEGMQGNAVDERWKAMAYGSFFLLDVNTVKTGYKRNSMGGSYCIPVGEYYDQMPVSYKGLVKRPDGDENTDFLSAGYGAESPIAKYVYYYWMMSHASVSGGTGESIQQVQNGQAITNNRKMINAWNEMCNEVETFYFFLDMHIADYPEFNLIPDARFSPLPINEFNLL